MILRELHLNGSMTRVEITEAVSQVTERTERTTYRSLASLLKGGFVIRTEIEVDGSVNAVYAPTDTGTYLASTRVDPRTTRARRAWVARRRKRGICIRCPRRTAAKGRRLCRLHIRKVCKKNLVRQQNRRINGLCMCGNVPLPDKSLCDECRDKAQRRSRDDRERRTKEGMCRQCHEPIAAGFGRLPFRVGIVSRSFCVKHLKLHNASKKRRSSVRSGSVFRQGIA